MTQPERPDATFHLDEYRFSTKCSVFLRNAQGDVLVQKKNTDSDASWALLLVVQRCSIVSRRFYPTDLTPVSAPMSEQ